MKEFIQKLLRKKLLEGRLASHTPSNPIGNKITAQATQEKIDAMQTRINDARRKVFSDTEKYGFKFNKETGQPTELRGQALYQIDLYPNGQLYGVPTSVGSKRMTDIDVESGVGKKKSFHVYSPSGVQHPDQPERAGTPVNKSGMVDAIDKLLALKGEDVLDFMIKHDKMKLGVDDYMVNKEPISQIQGSQGERRKAKFDAMAADKLKHQERLKTGSELDMNSREAIAILKKYAEKNGIEYWGDIPYKQQRDIVFKGAQVQKNQFKKSY